jgi:hypothetical protein
MRQVAFAAVSGERERRITLALICPTNWFTSTRLASTDAAEEIACAGIAGH